MQHRPIAAENVFSKAINWCVSYVWFVREFNATAAEIGDRRLNKDVQKA